METQVHRHCSSTLLPKVGYPMQLAAILAQIHRKVGIFEPKDARKLRLTEFSFMVQAAVYSQPDLYTLENNFKSIL